MELVQRESAPAQEGIDLAEQRLIFVQRYELDFDVHDKRGLQTLWRALEHHHLGALDVDLEQIDVRSLRNIVQTCGLNLMRSDDLEDLHQMLEIPCDCEVGLEQRRGERSAALVENPRRAIADEIR